MKKKQLKEFLKRYDKFKNNNLPTPFWDDERQTFEYVWFNPEISSLYYDDENLPSIQSSITDAMGDIACTGLYYPYSCNHFVCEEEDNREVIKKCYGHTHGHSFDEVVRDLYNFPESFKITKKDEEYYSHQELRYLKLVQKYLLFIGLTDLNKPNYSAKRYQNKRQKKYGMAYINFFPKKSIDDFIKGKRDFVVIKDNIKIYEQVKFDPSVKQIELIADEDGNNRLFIEYTGFKIVRYKDIKINYKSDELKDNDKVVIKYFKILEKL